MGLEYTFEHTDGGISLEFQTLSPLKARCIAKHNGLAAVHEAVPRLRFG